MAPSPDQRGMLADGAFVAPLFPLNEGELGRLVSLLSRRLEQEQQGVVGPLTYHDFSALCSIPVSEDAWRQVYASLRRVTDFQLNIASLAAPLKEWIDNGCDAIARARALGEISSDVTVSFDWQNDFGRGIVSVVDPVGMAFPDVLYYLNLPQVSSNSASLEGVQTIGQFGQGFMGGLGMLKAGLQVQVLPRGIYVPFLAQNDRGDWELRAGLGEFLANGTLCFRQVLLKDCLYLDVLTRPAGQDKGYRLRYFLGSDQKIHLHVSQEEGVAPGTRIEFSSPLLDSNDFVRLEQMVVQDYRFCDSFRIWLRSLGQPEQCVSDVLVRSQEQLRAQKRGRSKKKMRLEDAAYQILPIVSGEGEQGRLIYSSPHSLSEGEDAVLGGVLDILINGRKLMSFRLMGRAIPKHVALDFPASIGVTFQRDVLKFQDPLVQRFITSAVEQLLRDRNLSVLNALEPLLGENKVDCVDMIRRTLLQWQEEEGQLILPDQEGVAHLPNPLSGQNWIVAHPRFLKIKDMSTLFPASKVIKEGDVRLFFCSNMARAEIVVSEIDGWLYVFVAEELLSLPREQLQLWVGWLKEYLKTFVPRRGLNFDLNRCLSQMLDEEASGEDGHFEEVVIQEGSASEEGLSAQGMVEDSNADEDFIVRVDALFDIYPDTIWTSPDGYFLETRSFLIALMHQELGLEERDGSIDSFSQVICHFVGWTDLEELLVVNEELGGVGIKYDYLAFMVAILKRLKDLTVKTNEAGELVFKYDSGQQFITPFLIHEWIVQNVDGEEEDPTVDLYVYLTEDFFRFLEMEQRLRKDVEEELGPVDWDKLSWLYTVFIVKQLFEHSGQVGMPYLELKQRVWSTFLPQAKKMLPLIEQNEIFFKEQYAPVADLQSYNTFMYLSWSASKLDFELASIFSPDLFGLLDRVSSPRAKQALMELLHHFSPNKLLQSFALLSNSDLDAFLGEMLLPWEIAENAEFTDSIMYYFDAIVCDPVFLSQEIWPCLKPILGLSFAQRAWLNLAIVVLIQELKGRTLLEFSVDEEQCFVERQGYWRELSEQVFRYFQVNGLHTYEIFYHDILDFFEWVKRKTCPRNLVDRSDQEDDVERARTEELRAFRQGFTQQLLDGHNILGSFLYSRLQGQDCRGFLSVPEALLTAVCEEERVPVRRHFSAEVEQTFPQGEEAYFKTMFRSFSQSANRYRWIQEMINNAQEAGATKMAFQVYKGEDNHFYVRISDNGAGITPQNWPAFLVPFLSSKNSVSMDVSNPNFGWGWFNVFSMTDHVQVCTVAGEGERHVLDLRKDILGVDRADLQVIIATEKAEQLPAGTSFVLDFGDRDDLEMMALILEMRRVIAEYPLLDKGGMDIEVMEQRSHVLQTGSEKIIVSLIPLPGEVEPVGVSIERGGGGLFHGGLWLSNVPEQWLSFLPDWILKAYQQSGWALRVDYPKAARQGMNRSEVMDERINQAYLERIVIRALLRAIIEGVARNKLRDSDYFDLDYWLLWSNSISHTHLSLEMMLSLLNTEVVDVFARGASSPGAISGPLEGFIQQNFGQISFLDEHWQARLSLMASQNLQTFSWKDLLHGAFQDKNLVFMVLWFVGLEDRSQGGAFLNLYLMRHYLKDVAQEKGLIDERGNYVLLGDEKATLAVWGDCFDLLETRFPSSAWRFVRNSVHKVVHNLIRFKTEASLFENPVFDLEDLPPAYQQDKPLLAFMQGYARQVYLELNSPCVEIGFASKKIPAQAWTEAVSKRVVVNLQGTMFLGMQRLWRHFGHLEELERVKLFVPFLGTMTHEFIHQGEGPGQATHTPLFYESHRQILKTLSPVFSEGVAADPLAKGLVAMQRAGAQVGLVNPLVQARTLLPGRMIASEDSFSLSWEDLKLPVRSEVLLRVAPQTSVAANFREKGLDVVVINAADYYFLMGQGEVGENQLRALILFELEQVRMRREGYLVSLELEADSILRFVTSQPESVIDAYIAFFQERLREMRVEAEELEPGSFEKVLEMVQAAFKQRVALQQLETSSLKVDLLPKDLAVLRSAFDRESLVLARAA